MATTALATDTRNNETAFRRLAVGAPIFRRQIFKLPACSESASASYPSPSKNIVVRIKRVLSLLDGHFDLIPRPTITLNFMRAFDPARNSHDQRFPTKAQSTTGNEFSITPVGAAYAWQNLEWWSALCFHAQDRSSLEFQCQERTTPGD